MPFSNTIKKIFISIKPAISTVLLFTMTISLAFNPFAFSQGLGFSSFNRIIGPSPFVGINAKFRIQLFYFFNFIFVPICFIIAVLFCYCFLIRLMERKDDDNIQNALSFLNSSSICGLALMASLILNKYNIPIESNFEQFVHNLLYQYCVLFFPVVIGVAILVYINHPFIRFDVYRFGLFVGLVLSLYVNFLIQTNKSDVTHSYIRFFVVFIMAIIFAYVLLRKYKPSDFNRLCFSVVPLSFGLLAAGLSLEIFNILNQHDIFIVKRLTGAKLIFTIFGGCSILLFVQKKTV